MDAKTHSRYSSEALAIPYNRKLFFVTKPNQEGDLEDFLVELPRIRIDPSRKPPVVFKGLKLVERSTNDGAGVWHRTVVAYITASNDLIFAYSEPKDFDTAIFTKIREMKTYDDIWTFFDCCEKVEDYREFLEEVGTKLGDPDMFWLPLGADVFF